MDDARRGAERELGRVVTRLVALGPSRVARADAGGASPADAVRAQLQHLADAAAAAAGRPARAVPVLADRALGDQLVVLVRDLLDADEGAAPAVVERLVALRRAL